MWSSFVHVKSGRNSCTKTENGWCEKCCARGFPRLLKHLTRLPHDYKHKTMLFCCVKSDHYLCIFSVLTLFFSHTAYLYFSRPLIYIKMKPGECTKDKALCSRSIQWIPNRSKSKLELWIPIMVLNSHSPSAGIIWCAAGKCFSPGRLAAKILKAAGGFRNLYTLPQNAVSASEPQPPIFLSQKAGSWPQLQSASWTQTHWSRASVDP